ERPDVACTLIGLVPRDGAVCETSDDCEETELCDSQDLVCGEMVTGCVPVCGADSECADGQFCDFTSGLCTDAKPTGLPLGSVCESNATPDPCNGFCLTGNSDDEGQCSGLCAISTEGFTGCGFDGTGSAETACLFGTRVSVNGDVASGDVGLCGSLC